MFKPFATALACTLALAASPALSQAQTDAELAKSLGGNENGLRSYVLVLLKSGPTPVPAGPERAKMFQGHFANMERLAGEKKLVVAGPSDNANGLRGVFVLATTNMEEAKAWVATDPVIIQGEMVAEYHKFFSSAALMAVNDIHKRISRKP